MIFRKIIVPYVEKATRTFYVAQETEDKAVKFLERALAGIIMGFEGGNIWEARDGFPDSIVGSESKDWKVGDVDEKTFIEERENRERVSKDEAMTAWRSVERTVQRGQTNSRTWERIEQIRKYINQ